MKEQLQKDMIEAMKNHDKEKVNVIKLLKSAIQIEEINSKKELTDEDIINIIVKQVKMRNDAIDDFKKASRGDLIDSYSSEIKILECYLPKKLTDEEINEIIDEAFLSVKPTSKSDIGKIMKYVNPKLKARADMGYVSKIIKDRLS